MLLKLVAARSKRKSDIQRKEVFPEFLDDPNRLVGKQVKHLVRDPGQPVEWLPGKVLKVTQCKAIDTIYIIRYDGLSESESDWSFPLLKDMNKGELIILE